MEDVHKFRTVNWSPNGHSMSGAPQFVYDRLQRHWAAVKAYEFDPGPIAENGQYDLPHRGFGSEWKCDCGRPAPGEE